MIRTLLAPSRPAAVPLALLTLAAVAVLVGGVAHARLFHRGYAEVEVVGPLFLLNAIGSGVVVAAFALERVVLFVVGGLAISVGSLVSILISHSSSFFGFAEGGYDGAATLIVVAEVAAVLLIALGLVTGGVGAAARERAATGTTGVAA